jgi:hypothetical protein
MDLAALRLPFPTEDIEWRLQKTGAKDGKPWGLAVAYVDNRAIMDRLDQVCAPHLWHNQYVFGPHEAVLCGISIYVRLPDGTGQWVTKWDGAANTDIEPVKGGLSGSMKRAAVQWGIGRYLYNLPATFVKVGGNGTNYQPKKVKDGKTVHEAFNWSAPELPRWALPVGVAAPVTPAVTSPSAGLGGNRALGAANDWKDVRLPGSRMQLGGHGGRLVGDLTKHEAEVVMETFDRLTPEQREFHKLKIEALGEALAAFGL